MQFFSVIIPTFNRAHLIEKTIRSVLLQSFENFEVVLVDDGSTDNTKEVISNISDSRIKYIYQSNGERGKARNTGVLNAKGQYVFFLDSDDIIYSNHLQHAYDELSRLNFPVFFHSRYELISGTTITQVPKLNSKTVQKKISRQNLMACQFFLRTEQALEFPFSTNRKLKIGEDWLVLLKISSKFELHTSNIVTSAISQHDGRTMLLADHKCILESLEIIVDDLNKNHRISNDVIKNVKAELTTLAALSAAINGKKIKSIKLWLKGVSYKFQHIFTKRTLAISKKLIFNGKT
ncbi:MAG: glycosyltransferase family 2 protein [Crocinitomicaceae bacterium]